MAGVGRAFSPTPCTPYDRLVYGDDMRKRPPVDPTATIAYLRCSTDEQTMSGLGLDAQAAALDAEAARRGWAIVEHQTDHGRSGKNLARPALAAALDALDRGEAAILAVAKLDRLTRSVADLAAILERAQRGGWAVVALDAPVDTTTPMGEAMAHICGTFAQLERRLIAQRTTDALAAKKAAGARLGRPVTLPAEVRQRIAAERGRGVTLAAIADALTAESVPTARGGARWYPSTVAGVLGSLDRDREAAEAAA